MASRNWNVLKKKSFGTSNWYSSSFASGSSIGYPFSTVVSDTHGYSAGGVSPRVDGHLLLQQNAHAFERYRLTSYPTGYSWRDDNYWYLPADYPYYNYGGGSRWRATYNQIRFGVINSDSEQRASEAFYRDANAIKIFLAVAYRERQQTINLVAKSATKIARALLLVRKGNLKGASSALGFPGRTVRKRDSFSDQWLEFHYGWVPLYYDIYGAMIATASKPPRSPFKVTRQYSTSGRKYGSYGFTDWSYEDFVTAKGQMLVSDPSVVKNGELGLTNPALVAWELVPYSFVVDWFLPVGDWLQAQTALLGLGFEDTSITRTSIKRAQYTDNVGFNDTNRRSYSHTFGYAKLYHKTKSRCLGCIPAKPQLRFKSPVSVDHAVTALTLLNQRFKK